ncbi:transketolase [Propionicimonas sp.]|uniref:transketolase n=1 Tax=Propionicimonas sp. TaxID=1955623 RepID=UPI00182F7C09|nr:transketolase [Propionicimonas sp.]MBU3976678.1 transketolase [Actinomycetota bacterium]MBA3019744.1 transketolase [Propionicimonas sp.]MBU3986773.1 transketolase [Actinomycetota bacterium]MBU4006685.1 transketolase [Actinomycetota bacterium]MBU4065385.1 transketolase [Actinomycetota bacterium]
MQTVTRGQLANAVRALSIDAIEKANSGHPGMPLGMADAATALFVDHLRFDPSDPDWADRDRFVLSAGHGSMLLYSLLHLSGYNVTTGDLASFRQLGSKTAGHPEYGHCPGVETTTGPLGQGLATAVGMALAERMLNARFGDDLVNHHTYVIAGDGCLMEGISHEAIDLAGHLRLSRLIVLYDDNQITIEGATDLATSVNVDTRFEAVGWRVANVDGHDSEAVSVALAAARTADRPTLIRCHTTIGFGSPNRAGTSGIHGSPLGATEAAATKAALDWPYAPFEVPTEIRQAWLATTERGRSAHQEWRQRLDAADPALAAAFNQAISGTTSPEALSALAELADTFAGNATALASRQAGQQVIELLAGLEPALLGGSADLSGSTGSKASTHRPVVAGDYSGNYINYGIREHGMGAVLNGLALHGGWRPYGSTFLAFADYARPSVRLSALMAQPVVYVFTHDSIGLGEDGPTHQPVEHLASLRAIPGLNVIRPADAAETAHAWGVALTTSAPTALVLSRQTLPALPTASRTEGNPVARGGYVVVEPATARQVTLIATGSEVGLALAAARMLNAAGTGAAVVSLPSFELFAAQEESYRTQVLGTVPRVAIEAGIRQGWDGVLRTGDEFIGMTGFGASGPAEQLYEHFGITVAKLTETARQVIENANINAEKGN